MALFDEVLVGYIDGRRQVSWRRRAPGQPPGPAVRSVAGAVLRSARRSADLSQAELADLVGVTEATISSWEEGSSSLAEDPVHQIDRLERELLAAGADPRLVADLTVGAWCDVVNQSTADGEDTSCLFADPLKQKEAFSDLLNWAVTGQPPERHQL
jgi:transcriptional regulator with XRE-family HTH domain